MTMNKDWDEEVERIVKHIKRKRPKFNEKDFRAWLNERKKIGFMPFDFVLIWKCYKIWKRLRKDYDYWTIIAGREGEGKSTFGVQYGNFISLKGFHMCFSPEEFMEAMDKAKPYDSVQLDEGGVLLLSRESMSQTNRLIVKVGMVARQKNLNVILCVPNFFLIDTYIRDHRVNLLLQIKKRSKYRAVFGSGLKTISRDGVRYKNVIGIKIRPTKVWDGDFRKKLPESFDYESYLQNKTHHMDLLLKNRGVDSLGLKYVQAYRLAKEIGVKPETIRNWIQKGKIDGKRMGLKWFVTKKSYSKLIGGRGSI